MRFASIDPFISPAERTQTGFDVLHQPDAVPRCCRRARRQTRHFRQNPARVLSSWDGFWTLISLLLVRVFHETAIGGQRRAVPHVWAGLGGRNFLEFIRSDGFHIGGCNISFLCRK
jgi:hypothetical protein